MAAKKAKPQPGTPKHLANPSPAPEQPLANAQDPRRTERDARSSQDRDGNAEHVDGSRVPRPKK